MASQGLAKLDHAPDGRSRRGRAIDENRNDGWHRFPVKHLTQQPPPLPDEYAAHPLNAVYLKASQKDREERYATVEEMAWELRGSVDEDYEAIRALMESGMMEKPEFERPPTARRVAEDAKKDASRRTESDEAPPQKRSILNRLFGRK